MQPGNKNTVLRKPLSLVHALFTGAFVSEKDFVYIVKKEVREILTCLLALFK